MKGKSEPVLLTLAFAMAIVSVSSLSQCRDKSLSCSGACDSTAYPGISSSRGLQCMESCGLCRTVFTLPVCEQGYYDPGNDTCMPCSWRCRDATNCSSQATCPQGCSSRSHGHDCSKTCPSGCVGNCDRWTGLCTGGCKDGKWGHRCENTCSSRCDYKRCLQTSGYCKGCAQSHRYGDDCSKYCSYDCPLMSCDQHGYCNRNCYGAKWGILYAATCSSRCSKCDSLTGKCMRSCSNEFSNDFCLEECPDGTWGESCDKACPSSCPGPCQQLTGECGGACYEDRWSANCSRSCPCGCRDGVCHSLTTQCLHCQDGKWGRLCNLTCPQGCSRCPQLWAGCSECKEGYFLLDKNCTRCSPNCEGVCDRKNGSCQQCKRGFYGAKCDSKCHRGCKERVWEYTPRCHKDTGFCLEGCDNTRYGDTCNYSCSANCLRSRCTGKGSGLKCTDGCVDGFKGDYCQTACPSSCIKCNESKCLSCRGRQWGKACEKSCASGCHGNCYTDSGNCRTDCTDGWTGNRCDGRCRDNCQRCTRNGTCTECKRGYFLLDENCIRCPFNCEGVCDRKNGICQECKIGFYGVGCNFTCHGGCKDRLWGYTPRCHKDTGFCLDGCDSTRYGDTCNYSCSANCLRSRCTGKGSGLRCTDGCVDGFKGDYCQTACPSSCIKCDERKCLSCRGRQWGKACEKSCGSGCPGNCYTDSGDCRTDCTDGWTGSRCDGRCRDNCQRCYKWGACAVCKPGWYGDTCVSACGNCTGYKCSMYGGSCTDGCINGYYDDRCDKTCSPNCNRDDPESQICRQSSGYCLQGCVIGLWGSHCLYNCSAFCSRDNPEEQVCGQDEGNCLQGCQAGRYGSTCSLSCPANCLNRTCSQISGYCQLGCDPGWEGSRCDEACDEGRYGADCAQNCSATCQRGFPLCYHVNGVCLHGCKRGWRGLTCSQGVGVPLWSLGVAMLLSVLASLLLACLALRHPRCLCVRAWLCKTKGDPNPGDRNENVYEVMWSRDGREDNCMAAQTGSAEQGAGTEASCSEATGQGDYETLNFGLDASLADKKEKKEKEKKKKKRAGRGEARDGDNEDKKGETASQAKLQRSKSAGATDYACAKTTAPAGAKPASSEDKGRVQEREMDPSDTYVNFPKFDRQKAIAEAKAAGAYPQDKPWLSDLKAKTKARREVPQPQDDDDPASLYENLSVMK